MMDNETDRPLTREEIINLVREMNKAFGAMEQNRNLFYHEYLQAQEMRENERKALLDTQKRSSTLQRENNLIRDGITSLDDEITSLILKHATELPMPELSATAMASERAIYQLREVFAGLITKYNDFQDAAVNEERYKLQKAAFGMGLFYSALTQELMTKLGQQDDAGLPNSAADVSLALLSGVNVIGQKLKQMYETLNPLLPVQKKEDSPESVAAKPAHSDGETESKDVSVFESVRELETLVTDVASAPHFSSAALDNTIEMLEGENVNIHNARKYIHEEYLSRRKDYNSDSAETDINKEKVIGYLRNNLTVLDTILKSERASFETSGKKSDLLKILTEYRPMTEKGITHYLSRNPVSLDNILQSEMALRKTSGKISPLLEVLIKYGSKIVQSAEMRVPVDGGDSPVQLSLFPSTEEGSHYATQTRAGIPETGNDPVIQASESQSFLQKLWAPMARIYQNLKSITGAGDTQLKTEDGSGSDFDYGNTGAVPQKGIDHVEDDSAAGSRYEVVETPPEHVDDPVTLLDKKPRAPRVSNRSREESRKQDRENRATNYQRGTAAPPQTPNPAVMGGLEGTVSSEELKNDRKLIASTYVKIIPWGVAASLLFGTAYGSYLLYNQINATTPAQEAKPSHAYGTPISPTDSEAPSVPSPPPAESKTPNIPDSGVPPYQPTNPPDNTAPPAVPRKPLSNNPPVIAELKCEPYVNPGWDKSQICHISVSDDSKVSYCVVNSKTNNGDPKLKLKLQEHNYRMEINAAQGEFKFSPKEICAEPYCKGTMKARCYDNENKSSEEMKTEIKIEPTFHVTANRAPLDCVQDETIDDLLIYPTFKGKITSGASCSAPKLPDGLQWDKSRLRIYGSCPADPGRYSVRVTCKYSGISASKPINIKVNNDTEK